MEDTTPSALPTAIGPAEHSDPMDIADIDPEPDPVPPQPFVFDPSDVLAAARVLDEVFATLRSGWEAWGAVEDTVARLGVDLPAPCRGVLGQIASRPLRIERGGKPGAELDTGAAFGRDAVAMAGDEELSFWTALIDAVTSPAAVARLGELLFAKRAPNAGAHARRAVQAYLEAVASDDFAYHATAYLLRSWTLARKLKDQTLENAALETITRRVDILTMGGTGQHPGALYPLLQVLCRTPRDTSRAQAQRDHANRVLNALATSETQEHLIAEVAQLRRTLLDPGAGQERRAIIDSDEVAGYCRCAEDAPHPMVRMVLLEKAAKVATKRQLDTEAKRITALMQAIDPADLGLQVIRTSTSIPTWIPESILDPYTQAPSWHTGIALFCLDSNAPTGRLHANRANAEATGIGLLRLPNVLLSNGLPRFTTNSDEHLDQQNVARFAQTTAEFHGGLMAEGLRRIAERYGPPGGEDLTTYLLTLGAIDTRLARSLAKGFGYFWSGDYEACAAVVIPKIETAARALLRELDEPTYQVQVSAAKAGGHILLHPLLEALENVALDEDWAYFLRWLLSGPTGKNLRNDYAHGHIDVVTPTDAALLLRAAALLMSTASLMSPLVAR